MMNEENIFSQFNTPYHISKIHARINNLNFMKRKQRTKRNQQIKEAIYCCLWLSAVAFLVLVVVTELTKAGLI